MNIRKNIKSELNHLISIGSSEEENKKSVAITHRCNDISYYDIVMLVDGQHYCFVECNVTSIGAHAEHRAQELADKHGLRGPIQIAAEEAALQNHIDYLA